MTLSITIQNATPKRTAFCFFLHGDGMVALSSTRLHPHPHPHPLVACRLDSTTP